jgi:hypothetical protein
VKSPDAAFRLREAERESLVFLRSLRRYFAAAEGKAP